MKNLKFIQTYAISDSYSVMFCIFLIFLSTATKNPQQNPKHRKYIFWLTLRHLLNIYLFRDSNSQ